MGKKKTRKARVCGNCGESGHDKRTCEAVIEAAPKEVAAALTDLKAGLAERRKRNTEVILDALIDVVNGLTVKLNIPMHLDCAHHPEGSNVWLIDGPDLDGEQAVYALVGAVHQAQAAAAAQK
jgi:hypothetical protein